jgi:hypothetical protein
MNILKLPRYKTMNLGKVYFFSLYLICSFSLFAQPDWQTVFEKSGYVATPRYAESMEYFNRFAQETPSAKMISLGKSPQGRDLNCLIVSTDGAFTPEAARKTGKPVMLIVNGIHSGEIEGKDACMLLLRDILVTKSQAQLLDSVTLLVIPIFSVDGHERFAAFNRINQNGPVEMGWRTTAQNINLNRDWLKADAPEMQELLGLIKAWNPDFFVDTHTTDGADYQYTVTYGLEKFGNIETGLRTIVNKEFIPYIEKRVPEKGFLIAPYVGFREGEPKSGLVDGPATPRFSTGYASVRNRIGLLVETHMLKPYKDRVYATKAILEATLEYVHANAAKIVSANESAELNAMQTFSVAHQAFPVQFKSTGESTKFHYRGYVYRYDSSAISGTRKTVYTHEPFDEDIPYYNSIMIADSVVLPHAYIIPREWSLLVDRLRLHGVVVTETDRPVRLSVTKYKFRDVKFATGPYEGRQGVTCKYDAFTDTVDVPAGTFVVPVHQQSVRIIAHLLEPKSADSFLRWGFMNAIFEQKEYFEDYVMERIAPDMLAQNPQLKKEFEEKLATDPKFRDDPNQRLNFFYERSPYWDKSKNVYPVYRLETEQGL